MVAEQIWVSTAPLVQEYRAVGLVETGWRFAAAGVPAVEAQHWDDPDALDVMVALRGLTLPI